ncbi:MAG: hypothetical protein ACXAD7_02310 [Candidatus Kariarchaeaceae archaeon]
MSILALDTSEWKTGVGKGATVTQKIVEMNWTIAYPTGYRTIIYEVEGSLSNINSEVDTLVSHKITSISDAEISYTTTLTGNLMLGGESTDIIILDPQIIPRGELAYFSRSELLHPLTTTNTEIIQEWMPINDPREFAYSNTETEFSVGLKAYWAGHLHREFLITYDQETGFVTEAELIYYDAGEIMSYVKLETIEFEKGSISSDSSIFSLEIILTSLICIISFRIIRNRRKFNL